MKLLTLNTPPITQYAQALPAELSESLSDEGMERCANNLLQTCYAEYPVLFQTVLRRIAEQQIYQVNTEVEATSLEMLYPDFFDASTGKPLEEYERLLFKVSKIQTKLRDRLQKHYDDINSKIKEFVPSDVSDGMFDVPEARAQESVSIALIKNALKNAQMPRESWWPFGSKTITKQDAMNKFISDTQSITIPQYFHYSDIGKIGLKMVGHIPSKSSYVVLPAQVIALLYDHDFKRALHQQFDSIPKKLDLQTEIFDCAVICTIDTPADIATEVGNIELFLNHLHSSPSRARYLLGHILDDL